MDPVRFQEAYQRLRLLDERMTHKIRPRDAGFARLSQEQVEDRLHDLARYTLDLADVVEELFQAIASRAQTPATEAASRAQTPATEAASRTPPPED